jgi:hypothetical protein
MTDNITIKRRDTAAVIYHGPRDGLAGRNLSSADLSGTDLRGTDLRSANLRFADLSGTDLSDTDLLGADLTNANMCRANFSRANLSRANLSRAWLAGAKFCLEDGKPYILRDVWQAGPLGSRRDALTVFATDRGLMAQTGCFGPAPVEDFLAAVEETHGDNKHGRAYRAAIECARAAMEVYAP